MDRSEAHKKRWKRLQPEAYNLLNDYFCNVSRRPDDAAQKALAEKVRHIPGCEHYTAHHVKQYFSNTRSKMRDPGAKLPMGRGHKRRKGDLYQSPSTMPHIDPISVVSKLDVLLKEDPDPSIEMAEIWAESLGDDVFPEHILTYAFLRRASSRQGSIDEKWVAGPSADIHTPSLALAAPDILASGSSSGPSDYQSVQGSPSSPCQSPLPSLPLHHPSGDSTGHLTPAMNPSSLLLIPKVEEATLEGASNEAGSLSQTVRLSGPVRPSGRAASHATSPPQQLVILPEELAQGLRAAPLDSVSRDDSEIPKTFADFTRWLQQLNASAGIGTLS